MISAFSAIQNPPKLLDQVATRIRAKHYCILTEKNLLELN